MKPHNSRSGGTSPDIQKPLIDSEDVLQSAFERMKSSLFSERFVPFKFYPKNFEFEPNAKDSRIYVHQIAIEEHQRIDQQETHLFESDEAYSLQVFEDGRTLIKIVSYRGGLHALNTFSQLFYAHSEIDCENYTPYAPVNIKDSPVFQHRGLNLDISRNRISPNDVMRTLNAMSFNKFNRLHLHATDAQSWPLEIPSLPELALKGAYNHSQIWSVADLKEVQEYGVFRGVEVYIEIDLPGHTASIFHAYPSLITAYNQQPWQSYAAEPPSGQLKLNSPEVPPFLTTLFKDLLPRVLPYSSHFHVGGDELNKNAYTLDPTIKSSSRDIIRPYLQSFFDHDFSHITTHSLTPIVWEEVVLEWDLDLPKSIVIQIWRSQSSLKSVVAKGYKSLFGPCANWYLDCGYGSWVDPDPSNPNTPVKSPFLDWCSPYKNWREIYSYDPLEDIPEDQKHLVLGGEVHLWGELTDSVTLDGMLWPRAAAAAEVLWKGKGKVSEDTTRRLAEMRERLLGRGIGAGMVQMEWSLSNRGGSLL